MLIQLTTPRPVLDHTEHPAYVHLHTLFKAGVSDAKVLFTSMKDPEHGTYDTKELEPTHEMPLDASDGCQANIYILPFWELFKSEDKKRNLWLVPFCTAGFKIVATSAFRDSPHTYESRSMTFTIMMPVTGGGVIRLGDSMFDITNPSFDPWAPCPTSMYPAQVAELQYSYNKAHKIRGRKVEYPGLTHQDVPRLGPKAEPKLPSGFGLKQLSDGTQEITRKDK